MSAIEVLDTIRLLLIAQVILTAAYWLVDRRHDCDHGAIANCGPCARERHARAERKRAEACRWFHRQYGESGCPHHEKDP